MTEMLKVRIVDPSSTEVAALIVALSNELAVRYDFADDGSGKFKPEDANVPRSGFVVGYIDGNAIACGAFRPLDGSVCEFKRMFVRPECRGHGYSRTVLRELERLAVDAGYTVARLETGSRKQSAYMSIADITAFRISEFKSTAKDACVLKNSWKTILQADSADNRLNRNCGPRWFWDQFHPHVKPNVPSSTTTLRTRLVNQIPRELVTKIRATG